jgi:methionyl aminopeptidase
MIPIKNERQIVRMREACAIAADVLQELRALVRPGISTQDLEEAGRDAIAKRGAKSACYGYQVGSRRYPAHTCISVNEEVVHGIPSFRRILRDGDVVAMDVVEVSPPYDHADITSLAASSLVMEYLCLKAWAKGARAAPLAE